MKKLLLTVFAISTFLFFTSCGSTPKAEETTEPETPVVEETIEDAVEETVEEIKDTKDEIDQEAINAKNEALLKAVAESRKAAVDAGAETQAPDKLKQIDELSDLLKEKANNGEDISQDAVEIQNLYLALAAYSNAKEAKQMIDDENMAYLAQSVYDEGCNHLNKCDELLTDESTTSAALLEEATKANANFNSVLFIAYKKMAKQERDEAYKAKRDADSVKAAVARSDDYKAATELFTKGDQMYSMQNAPKAYKNYKAAKEAYTTLYTEVSEKRAAAQKAIEAAKARVAESEDFAAKADLEAPITEKVEGIEDEDAVLLEEDNFEDPEKAEADIPEDVEDPVDSAVKEAVNAIESVL